MKKKQKRATFLKILLVFLLFIIVLDLVVLITLHAKNKPLFLAPPGYLLVRGVLLTLVVLLAALSLLPW